MTIGTKATRTARPGGHRPRNRKECKQREPLHFYFSERLEVNEYDEKGERAPKNNALYTVATRREEAPSFMNCGVLLVVTSGRTQEDRN